MDSKDYYAKAVNFTLEAADFRRALVKSKSGISELGEESSSILTSLSDGLDGAVNQMSAARELNEAISNARDEPRDKYGFENPAKIEANKNVQFGRRKTAAAVSSLCYKLMEIHDELISQHRENPKLLNPLIDEIESIAAANKELFAETATALDKKNAHRGHPTSKAFYGLSAAMGVLALAAGLALPSLKGKVAAEVALGTAQASFVAANRRGKQWRNEDNKKAVGRMKTGKILSERTSEQEEGRER